MVARFKGARWPVIIATQIVSLNGFVDRIVHAYDPVGGSVWMRSLPAPFAGSPAAADLKGDGDVELLEFLSLGAVWVQRSDGESLAASNTSQVATGGSLMPEIVVANGRSGRPLVMWPYLGRLFAWNIASPDSVVDDLMGDGTPTVADLDGDGRLELLIGSSHHSLLYVYETGAPAAGNAQLWPTSRGNAARTGAAAMPLGPIADVIPPRAVTNLTWSEAGTDAVDLTWTAPFEGRGKRAARYDLRLAPGPITAGDFASHTPVSGVPVPGPAGSHEHARISGLEQNRNLSFALESVDSAGNQSALSNVVAVRLPAPTSGTVTDLRIAGEIDTRFDLVWTSAAAPGARGASWTYQLGASRTPLDADRFATAEIVMDVPGTVAGGGEEHARLGPLEAGERYWIALRARDSVGHLSPISNVVSGATLVQNETMRGARLVVGPNPGRTALSLFWRIDAGSALEPSRLEIFDASGRRCWQRRLPASHEGLSVWNGRTDDGAALPAGLYFARLETRRASVTTRFVLIE